MPETNNDRLLPMIWSVDVVLGKPIAKDVRC